MKKQILLDTTLPEVAYWYMKKKRMEMTTGNLFEVMKQISNRIDLINKNQKAKIIDFIDGGCLLKK